MAENKLSVTGRERLSWYMYDWANSAFYATVVTVFLGPYLTNITQNAADAQGYVHPLGIRVLAGSFFPYLISLSVLLQVLVLPLVGALADYSQRKKFLLGLFAYTGAFATMGLYFLEGKNYLLGGILFLVANLAFGSSLVVYNAFLPEISSPEERDGVSSRGWALGYLGGGVLLALNLMLFSQAEKFGLTGGEAVRISLCSAGIWWAVFTLFPLIGLKRRQAAVSVPHGKSYFSAGFSQLAGTFRQLRKQPHTMLFLGAYLLYNDGVQTVIALASQFGQEELHLPIASLTTAILMVQFVAFFGSLGFNLLAKYFGGKNSIIVSLVLWTGTLIYAYGFMRTEAHFYILAAIVGIVMGGSQALSRSLYSLMIPKGREAEYFSFYEVSDKGTSWLGTLFFGLALQFTGSYRTAILSLIVFFIAGIILLLRVNISRARQEAEQFSDMPEKREHYPASV